MRDARQDAGGQGQSATRCSAAGKDGAAGLHASGTNRRAGAVGAETLPASPAAAVQAEGSAATYERAQRVAAAVCGFCRAEFPDQTAVRVHCLTNHGNGRGTF